MHLRPTEDRASIAFVDCKIAPTNQNEISAMESSFFIAWSVVTSNGRSDYIAIEMRIDDMHTQ